MTVVWDVIAFLAALLGGFLVLSSIGPEYSAPQTAAQAVVGIGIAAIPYFVSAMARRAEAASLLKQISKSYGDIQNATDAQKLLDEQVG